MLTIVDCDSDVCCFRLHWNIVCCYCCFYCHCWWWLWVVVAAATAIGCKAIAKKSQPTVALSQIPATMPERVLGKTNVSLPILGLGGAGQTPISKRGQDKAAIALIEKALELGIRYFDTAEMYGGGVSEQQFGQVLPAYREQVYINSKTDARDYDGAWKHLEQSLKFLKTDYLDCWQMHHVSFQEELDRIFGSNGAIKAVEEAKEQGVRYKIVQWTWGDVVMALDLGFESGDRKPR